jgi:integrase
MNPGRHIEGSTAVAEPEPEHDDRLQLVRRFQRFTNEWPWHWRPGDVEDFSAELRGRRPGGALSTIRGYQSHLRLFCEYVADPRYEWTAASEQLFGAHPSQVCLEWSTAVHTAEQEGRSQRRALTKRELQDLFDCADDQVTAARTSGRKGWLTMLREATAFKVAYVWGLRRREVVTLDRPDLGTADAGGDPPPAWNPGVSPRCSPQTRGDRLWWLPKAVTVECSPRTRG